MVPKGWSRSQIGEIANVQVGRDLIGERIDGDLREARKVALDDFAQRFG